MRYLWLVCCFLFISCKNTSDKKEVKSVVKSEIEEVVKEKVTQTIPKKIVIPSKDGLEMTADLYLAGDKEVTVLLCHQAGYSRGEYIQTAKILLENGYSSLAIDQRSGKEANGVINETAKRASEKGLATHYLDARQDIEAAIDYVYELNGNQPIILVGSSYSASLALLIGVESTKVKAIIAFSPGEYFQGTNIKNRIKGLDKPTFVTSSKKEAAKLTEMMSLVNNEILMHYIPKVDGIHGSRALWESTEGNEGYWDALESFNMVFLQN